MSRLLDGQLWVARGSSRGYAIHPASIGSIFRVRPQPVLHVRRRWDVQGAGFTSKPAIRLSKMNALSSALADVRRIGIQRWLHGALLSSTIRCAEYQGSGNANHSSRSATRISQSARPVDARAMIKNRKRNQFKLWYVSVLLQKRVRLLLAPPDR